MKIFKALQLTTLMAMTFYGITGCAATYSAGSGTAYSNPPWAPPYTAGVRYYYLPDIETYYDLSNNDFVYLDDGQWLFTSSLPTIYSNYDLYNGFSVALNSGVYQPWMHNRYYASNYPRYYYRTKYQGMQNAGIRGFNENQRKPVFNTSPARNTANPSGQYPFTLQNNTAPKAVTTRPAQQPSYQGKNVGQPVKVMRNMRQGRMEGGNANNMGNRNATGGGHENNSNGRPH